jgi:hypothetical protein
LRGNGALIGNVVVLSGATVAPGSSIGALTFSNNLVLGGGSTTAMEVDSTLSTNDALIVTGAITYGGTLALETVDGEFSATNHFKLFSAANYNGAFSAIVPSVPGAGLQWNTNTLAVDGTLRIDLVVPPTPPTFTGARLSSGNVILDGTNGPAGLEYYVLSSTNVALPVIQWNRVATNSFDPTGNFIFTNLIDLDKPTEFFRLQLP